MRFHWDAVTRGERGFEWPEFLAAVETLPLKQVWRHNQAGDLPGKGDKIDAEMLQQLVAANRKASAHGFTYTHKPMTPENAAAVRHANANGFTVNLSADTLREADELVAQKIGPVAVILPHDAPESLETPAGNRVIVCPAQTRDRVNCVNCKLCCDADRKVIIGFQAHGSGSKVVERQVQKLEEEEKHGHQIKKPAPPPKARAKTPPSRGLPLGSWSAVGRKNSKAAGSPVV